MPVLPFIGDNEDNVVNARCDEFGIVYKMEDIIEAYREPYGSPTAAPSCRCSE